MLPPDLGAEADASSLLVRPAEPPAAVFDLAALREAIRRERKVTLDCEDKQGRASRRTVWPFALGDFDRVRMIAAWCEARDDFRHFRIDRIARLEVAEARYPRRRVALLKAWREREGVAPQ